MSQQHIVIVGAGIVGLSTAYSLLQQGIKNVTVIEQAAVDHPRGTSHGVSRLLRFEYGADMLYSQMVQKSLNLWRDLERISQRTLYTPTGLLVLGKWNDDYTQASYKTSNALGLLSTRLSRETCTQRFPQFNYRLFDQFTYNSNAGLLHASLCLHTLKKLILDLGGTILEGYQVTHLAHAHWYYPLHLHFKNGESLQADRVVLAMGPWVHSLLSELQLPVRITRQYALYFANVPTSSFKLHTFPAFIADDLYGFPLHCTATGNGPGWLKVASHAFGASIDPDNPLSSDEQTITKLTRQFHQLIPALRNARLAHVDACMYDVSPDEDFILDHFPDDPRIVFASGLSGHAFKFGPLLGAIMSSMVLQKESPVPLQRFRLSRFAPVEQPQPETISVA